MIFGKEMFMGEGAGIRCLATLAFALCTLALGAPAVHANTGDIIAPQNDPHTPADGWQAGTCTTDTPIECSIDTPDQFFRQAGGHPQVGFTQFIVKEGPGALPGTQVPVGNLKTVRVDLPAGLTVNPQATPQCDLAPGASPTSSNCPASSKVGTSTVTAENPDTGFSLTLDPADVFNLVPRDGQPALFGLSILGNDAYLEAGVAWEGDYHEYFTIHVAKLSLPGDPAFLPLGDAARIAKNRLVFDGRAGDGTFITTPSTCFDPAVSGFEHVYSTYLRADSYEMPNPTFPEGSSFWESPLPPGEKPLNCDQVVLDDSSLSVDPQTTQTDSPSGAAVEVDVPHIPGGANVARSNVKDAHVTLPAGMGLNPSAADGLVACTDAQFGKGTREPVACPPASKVGTVAVQTPPLPPDSLAGEVYVGQQLSRDPTSGQAFRIFVDVESARYGISARLIGNVAADPQTGQLTTTFADNPQVPFSSFQIDFDDGPKAPLSSPPLCGPNASAAQLDPWSGTSPALLSSDFTLTSAPGGGTCAETLVARPFGPGFDAATTNPKGGGHTQMQTGVTRADGDQELKGVNLDLPPGLTAKLAGVPYCPEAAIAAAAANSGVAEATGPSCPPASLVGSASIRSGSGPSPIGIEGKVFLSGPYHGAPLSLTVVTPATAGPFDLGSVVVRVALFVDPRTAQVHAVSDPIPHVFGGVLLHIRSIDVKVDRPNFLLNPTNCSPMAIGATLFGGGADPLDPAAFSGIAASVPFQASGCEKLGFAPKLSLRLFGAMRRAKNPKLRAVLIAREGDANIGRAAVTLPPTLFLDQSNLTKVCTRPQYAAGACPSESVYGYAVAHTPLLDEPLRGPVYLRTSDNLLPDLVASLHGQVNVELVGRVDSLKGRIRNTFDVLPDVPVSKFVLNMRGGKRGLLVNSTHQCKERGMRARAIVRFRAQNGKKANQRRRLRTSCPKHRQHRGHRR
ncbi:MAG TPA: hypothetical protein VF176_08475 [Solirubrobacterales bacterium]